MSFKDEQQNNTHSDSAYGGCKYRLSYDAVSNKQKKAKLCLTDKTKRVALTVSVIAVFIAFGMFIFTYYKNAVKDIFHDGETGQTERSTYGTGSGVNVINE